MKPISNICAVVLAAGESKRMGTPKALLEFADGTSLLEHQARLLEEAGCDPIVCVVGANADLVRELEERLDIKWVLNEDWEQGQFTSIQTGLAWTLDVGAQGALVHPVDVVLEKPGTARSILEAALMNPHLDALVPEHDGRGGHPVYVSKQMAMEVIKIDPDKPDARLDAQISKADSAMRLPVNDAGILRNVNTPEEWNEVKSEVLKPNPKS